MTFFEKKHYKTFQSHLWEKGSRNERNYAKANEKEKVSIPSLGKRVAQQGIFIPIFGCSMVSIPSLGKRVAQQYAHDLLDVYISSFNPISGKKGRATKTAST